MASAPDFSDAPHIVVSDREPPKRRRIRVASPPMPAATKRLEAANPTPNPPDDDVATQPPIAAAATSAPVAAKLATRLANPPADPAPQPPAAAATTPAKLIDPPATAVKPPKRRRFRLFAALFAPFRDVDDRAVRKKRQNGQIRNNSKGNLFAMGVAAPVKVPVNKVPVKRFPRGDD